MLGRLLATGMVLALLTGACGSGSSDADTTGPGTVGVSMSEQVSIGSALAQMRGHHRVALELYASGDQDTAGLHTRHPIEENLATVGAGAALEASLEEVRDLVADGAPTGRVRQAMDAAATATFESLESVAAERDPGFVGSVLADLLSTAAHEYDEAFAGDVVALEEYQDAYGFVLEAESLYETIEADVSAASTEEAEEIEEAFEVLTTALASPEAPKPPTPPLDVEAAADLIGHELEETVGAVLAEKADPEEIGEEIEELVTAAVKAYRAGDAAEAAELVAEAYLENYEVIEAEVIEHAPEINSELEPLLGAELRRKIQEGASVATVEEMADKALELLEVALEVLEHEE